MKLLILTESIGKTAPGRVFERITYGLSQIYKIDLVTSEYSPSLNFNMNVRVLKFKKKKIHPYIFKPLISIFGINPFDILYTKQIISYLEKNKFSDYDYILSFLSNHHFSSLILGSKLSIILNSKFIVYSVDAIPAPGWPENKFYFNSVKKLINKYLRSVDFIFSSNHEMLNYQLTTFQNKQNLISNVLYNPNLGKPINYPIAQNNFNSFLYTGKLYGLRNAKYILKAFEMLLIDHPNSILVFLEAQISQNLLNLLDKRTLKKIEFHPYCEQLDKFYQDSTALIDIDAEIENDVFLSSKITNYIMINRIIISQTGKYSPSRRIFKGIDSIIQCDHDSVQLYEAMKKAIQIKDSVNFHDRNEVISLFNLSNVIMDFSETLISGKKTNI